jgi:LCP family protein required for cell wall assembly
LLLAKVGIALAGTVGMLTLLGLIWPRPDPSLQPRREVTAANLAPAPRRAITVLVIGSDAERSGDTRNGAAPPGPANSDALLLARVNPDGPLQLLNLPSDLAVQLPGREEPVRLGSLYRIGGVSLVADVVSDMVGLPSGAPERYLVLPRRVLRKMVDGVGGLEIDPPRRMRYEDKSQKLKIDLQSGLQRLDGSQVEQMVRYRDKWLGESGRRTNHELVEKALWEQLRRPDQLVRLPGLLADLSGQVQTNISQDEALSLLAAALSDEGRPQFTSLPLAPIDKDHKGFRQLKKDAEPPLWKAP